MLVPKNPGFEKIAAQIDATVAAWRIENADAISAERSHKIASDEYFEMLVQDPERFATAIVKEALDGDLPAANAVDDSLEYAHERRLPSVFLSALVHYLKSGRAPARSLYAPENRKLSNAARDIGFTKVVFQIHREVLAKGWRVQLSKSSDGKSSLVALVGKHFDMKEAQARIVFNERKTVVGLIEAFRAQYPGHSRAEEKRLFLEHHSLV
jgi:hypothetical protein